MPNREMAKLRGRHAQKMHALFREFLALNPTVDPDLDEDTWTPEQTQQWWQLTKSETLRFIEAQRKLAKRLRGEGI